MKSGLIIEILKNIFWIVLGFFLNEIYTYYKEKNKRKTLRKAVQKLSNKFQQTSDVFVIETGDPFYTFSDISIQDSQKKLIIEIPEKYKAEIKRLKPSWVFRDGISYDGSRVYEDIALMTGIADIVSQIEEHRNIVAENFIKILNDTPDMLFNGGTVGIYRILPDRENDFEKSKIKFITYSSDFFTQKVFASIYQQLRLQNHNISTIEKLEQLTDPSCNYAPFIGGIAATTFVLLYNGQSVVLAKRSEYINSKQKKWHYSIDEGFNQNHYEFGKPSFRQCFYDGLHSELGISRDISAAYPPQLFDIVFHRNVFELEFTSIFYYPGSYDELYKDYLTRAKDGRLESYELKEILISKDSIDSFLKSNDTTEGCKLSLQLLYHRHKHGDITRVV